MWVCIPTLQTRIIELQTIQAPTIKAKRSLELGVFLFSFPFPFLAFPLQNESKH